MTITPMPAADREVRQSGPLLDEWQIMQGIGRCLHQRLVPWLDEVARQQGDPVRVQRPKWIGVWRGEQGLPDEQIPRVMVLCRDTDKVEHRSDGEVWAWWDVQVGALVDMTDDGGTGAIRFASIYGAAIRACVAIHAVAHLDQLANVEWTGGRTDGLLPTGAVTTQKFRVLAGPMFATSGALEPQPPDPEPEGPDDQGDQPVVIETNLELEAVAGPLEDEQ